MRALSICAGVSAQAVTSRRELLCKWCSNYWALQHLDEAELSRMVGDLQIITFEKAEPVSRANVLFSQFFAVFACCIREKCAAVGHILAKGCLGGSAA